MLALERLGERILVDSLLPPEEGPRHPELAHLHAEVRYLPKRPHLGDRPVWHAHLRMVGKTPLLWTRLARVARREGTWRRFLQAGLVAVRARRAGARHIHAHFATAAAEVARDAGRLAGIPVTVTAHAKDIYRADNAALLPRRVEGAAAVVTVSEYNVRHLRALLDGSTRVRQVPNGVEVAPPAPVRPDGPVLCVARLVEKKGVDVLIDAVALLESSL